MRADVAGSHRDLPIKWGWFASDASGTIPCDAVHPTPCQYSFSYCNPSLILNVKMSLNARYHAGKEDSCRFRQEHGCGEWPFSQLVGSGFVCNRVLSWRRHCSQLFCLCGK